jgi:two-component system NtrC family sensor kinase
LVARDGGAREEALAETTRWAAAEQDRADELGRARDALSRTIDELTRTQSALVAASEKAARANQELAAKVTELERLERELRLAQRLEAVGRLSAGVAHEINTPVQFVGDSLHFLREAYTEVRAEVRRLAGEPDGAPADLPYLDEEVPRAFEQAGAGIQRIARIVRAMKTFSSDGRGGVAAYDVNRGVETALELVRGELNHIAEVVTDFMEIPPVQCRADEMNQALLNLIENAAHAMQDAVAAGRPRGVLCLRTRQEGDSVVVSVQDTGTGIPDDIKDRIFDLFFTTKEVGRGTGHGLSMVWSAVVDNLGGKVWVDSELGVGTTFHVKLPATES